MRVLGFAIASLVMATPLFATPNQLELQGVTQVQQHWECVPIARAISGIQIYGDAHTWWSQAEGRYRRGNQPKRGAVLAFKAYGSMRLGHVAAVSRLIDDRTILVTHSNWSLIDGRRGQIEKNVRVVDVSDANDWSRVRVWFAPLQDLGTTEWPTHGFIYPNDVPPMSIPSNARYANAPNTVTPRAPILVPDKARVNAEKNKAKDERKLAEKAEKKQKKAQKDERALLDPKPTGRIAYLAKLLPKLQ
jgi:surface antigen